MQNVLLNNGVTRHDFLKGCSYVAATALLGGCGSNDRFNPNPNPNPDEIGDSFNFHIHPSADVLDSVQSHVKFVTNKMDAVVESSQPMFMLSSPSVSHDGSFNPLTKTYGQPEILHLSNDTDGKTYVEINTNSHENNIGLVKECIEIGSTIDIKGSNGLSYTYNDIVGCNGSKHNTVTQNGKFISQKMAIVSANSKMALDDDWNDIEVWYDIMTHNDNTALTNQMMLIYQYDEVDSISNGSNSDLSSPWQTINLLESLGDYWTYTLAQAKEFAETARGVGYYASPLQDKLEQFSNYSPSIEDVSRYKDAQGKEFLYGTVSLGYFYSFGFIVTFDGAEPDIHWYIPEELNFSTEDTEEGYIYIDYAVRYVYLSRLVNGDILLNKDDQYDSLTYLLTFVDKKTLEDNLGKCIYKPMAMVDDKVVMSYQTFYISFSTNPKRSEMISYIQVPLKASAGTVSSIPTQDPDQKFHATDLVHLGYTDYDANLKNGSSSYGDYSFEDIQNSFYADQYYNDDGSYLLTRFIASSTPSGLWNQSQILFTYMETPFAFTFGGDSQENEIDHDTSTQWYVEQGLIPETENSISDYLGSDCDIEYSSNHQGDSFIHLIPKDPEKLSFSWKMTSEKEYFTPQPIAYGVKRVLPWSHYLHDLELLYVGEEQKSVAPLANGANAGSLRDLTFQSSGTKESYFHAHRDYLEKNWKLVELQNAPKEAPKKVESIHKVKQKIHQATLVITDQNHNAVTLSKNLHVEIRCNSAVSMQDVTNPDKIKKVQLNRTTSYLAKDDGQGHVKLQIDVGHENDLLTAVDLHYRIVDVGENGISAFENPNPGSPEKIIDTSENSLTTQWASFNISYLLHGRNAKMDTLQPTAPSGTEHVQDKYSSNIDDKYASQKDKLITSTKSAFTKVSNGASVQTTSLLFLKNDSENASPLYAVRTLGGTTQNYSLELEGFWDDVSEAVSHAKQIAKSVEAAAERAAEAAIKLAKALKDAVNKLIKNLDNLLKDLTKALSSVLDGIVSFCTSIIKAYISYLKLLIDLLKGLFDFSMAFDVGAGLKQLIEDNFTLEDSGIFSYIKSDMTAQNEQSEPAILSFLNTHKSKASEVSQHVSQVNQLPSKAQTNSIEAKKSRHSNATHNNHTQNQISQNIDFSALSDIKNLFKGIESSVSDMATDIEKTDLSALGPDMEKSMKTIEKDIVNIAEDAFKCIISEVLETFTVSLKEFLETSLPNEVKTLLNAIIVPLFGLGDRTFKTDSDILFFLFGYGINITSVIGSDLMNIVAPNVKNINVSELLANKGAYKGKTKDICQSYNGINTKLSSVTPFEYIDYAVVTTHASVFFMMIPMYVMSEEERSQVPFQFHEKLFKIGILSIELISFAMKEIVLISKNEEEEWEKAILGTKLVLKLFHMLPDSNRLPKGTFTALYAVGTTVTDMLDIVHKFEKKDDIPGAISIIELVAALTDIVFDIRTEDEAASPKEVAAFVALLIILHGVIDFGETAIID